MARRRMITPSFWTDDSVLELDVEARLLFIGMWNFADDDGIIANKPKQLKAQIYPGDNYTHEQISEWLMSIHEQKLILFGNEGQLIKIKGWSTYQKINRPTPSIYTFNKDDSLSNHGVLKPNRKEEKVKEVKRKEVKVQIKDDLKRSLFEQFYNMYPRKVKRQNAVKAFNRLNKQEMQLAIDILPRHVKYWQDKGIDKEFIPHPSTWLNGKQWEDELVGHAITSQPTDKELRLREMIKRKQEEYVRQKEETQEDTTTNLHDIYSLDVKQQESGNLNIKEALSNLKSK